MDAIESGYIGCTVRVYVWEISSSNGLLAACGLCAYLFLFFQAASLPVVATCAQVHKVCTTPNTGCQGPACALCDICEISGLL